MQSIPVPIIIVLNFGLLSLLAWGLGRLSPFYRKQLQVEDLTRLTPLDGLRGLLCVAVLNHHALFNLGAVTLHSWDIPPDASRSFGQMLGRTAVPLFFCVTGYLFHSKLLKDNGALNVITFFRSRILRIAPLYLTSYLAATLLAGPQIQWSLGVVCDHVIRGLSLGLLPWDNRPGIVFREVNARVEWTLYYEWLYYFSVPLVALGVRYLSTRTALLLVIICYLGNLYIDNISTYFYIGILAAYAPKSPELTRCLRTPAVALFILVLLAYQPLLHYMSKEHWNYFLLLLVFVPIASGNSLLGLLNTSGLRLLGLISYSIYLMHGIVQWAGRQTLASLLSGFDSPVLAFSLWLVPVSVLTLALSTLTYRWVEWPAMAWDKAIRRRERQKAGHKAAAGVSAREPSAINTAG